MTRRTAAPVVFVTGASRGLGQALAEAFAADGANVAIGARNDARLNEVAARCGSETLAVRLDVSNEGACVEAIALCEAHFGRIDVLINNAGVAESAKFLDTDTALLRRTMGVDLDGPIWLTKAALPGMLERRQGRVISIASIASRRGFAYVTAYVAAKHALLGLTRALAVEFATSGVTFNCVCPYYIDTPMYRATIENIVRLTGRSEQEVTRHLMNPQGRLTETDEVVGVCRLLASNAGRGINGQAINVDGGLCQS